jgi:glucose/arabinose dehydrogenase
MSTVRIVWFVGVLLAAGALYLVLSGPPAKPAVAPAVVMPGEAAPAPAAPTAPAATSAPAQPAVPTPPAAEPAPAPSVPVVRSADAVNLGLDHPVKEAKVIAGNIVQAFASTGPPP